MSAEAPPHKDALFNGTDCHFEEGPDGESANPPANSGLLSFAALRVGMTIQSCTPEYSANLCGLCGSPSPAAELLASVPGLGYSYPGILEKCV